MALAPSSPMLLSVAAQLQVGQVHRRPRVLARWLFVPARSPGAPSSNFSGQGLIATTTRMAAGLQPDYIQT